MYITQLAALSLSCSFECPAALSSAYNVYTQPPFQAPETRRGMIQTLTGTHALALMCTCTWKGVLGPEEARVGMKRVMTVARRQ